MLTELMENIRNEMICNLPERKFRQNPFDMMKTDISENEKAYQLMVHLPGYDKENLQVELKEGYLTVTAKSSSENEEKKDEKQYIHREWYQGSFSRSFYVGTEVSREQIRAVYKNGVLKLTVPKTASQETEKTVIEIA